MFQKLRSLVPFVIQEYAEFLHEFMCAVKQNYGEKVLVQVNHMIGIAKSWLFNIVFDITLQVLLVSV